MKSSAVSPWSCSAAPLTSRVSLSYRMIADGAQILWTAKGSNS